MKEIIDSILQAEEMAAQIVDAATEKAAKINAERDADSEKAKARASLSFSAERKKTLLEAEKTAKDLYDKQIEQANKEALDLKDQVAIKQDAIVDQIVNGIIR